MQETPESRRELLFGALSRIAEGGRAEVPAIQVDEPIIESPLTRPSRRLVLGTTALLTAAGVAGVASANPQVESERLDMIDWSDALGEELDARAETILTEWVEVIEAERAPAIDWMKAVLRLRLQTYYDENFVEPWDKRLLQFQLNDVPRLLAEGEGACQRAYLDLLGEMAEENRIMLVVINRILMDAENPLIGSTPQLLATELEEIEKLPLEDQIEELQALTDKVYETIGHRASEGNSRNELAQAWMYLTELLKRKINEAATPPSVDDGEPRELFADEDDEDAIAVREGPVPIFDERGEPGTQPADPLQADLDVLVGAPQEDPYNTIYNLVISSQLAIVMSQALNYDWEDADIHHDWRLKKRIRRIERNEGAFDLEEWMHEKHCPGVGCYYAPRREKDGLIPHLKSHYVAELDRILYPYIDRIIDQAKGGEGEKTLNEQASQRTDLHPLVQVAIKEWVWRKSVHPFQNPGSLGINVNGLGEWRTKSQAVGSAEHALRTGFVAMLTKLDPQVILVFETVNEHRASDDFSRQYPRVEIYPKHRIYQGLRYAEDVPPEAIRIEAIMDATPDNSMNRETFEREVLRLGEDPSYWLVTSWEDQERYCKHQHYFAYGLDPETYEPVGMERALEHCAQLNFRELLKPMARGAASARQIHDWHETRGVPEELD